MDMLRLAGIFGIMFGMYGILLCWNQQKQQKICTLEAVCFLLKRAKYALGVEQQRVIDFFSQVKTGDALLDEFCRNFSAALQEHTYKTGEQAWSALWRKNDKKAGLGKEELSFVQESGKVFFGKSRQEIIDFSENYEKRCEELIGSCRAEYKEQRKVYIPVSVLSGVMLIIILL